MIFSVVFKYVVEFNRFESVLKYKLCFRRKSRLGVLAWFNWYLGPIYEGFFACSLYSYFSKGFSLSFPCKDASVNCVLNVCTGKSSLFSFWSKFGFFIMFWFFFLYLFKESFARSRFFNSAFGILWIFCLYSIIIIFY